MPNCICSPGSNLSTFQADFIFSSATGALIMEITYGMNIESHKDKFLQTAEHAMEYIEKIMIPGAFPVDTFPIRSFSLRCANPSH